MTKDRVNNMDTATTIINLTSNIERTLELSQKRGALIDHENGEGVITCEFEDGSMIIIDGNEIYTEKVY